MIGPLTLRLCVTAYICLILILHRPTLHFFVLRFLAFPFRSYNHCLTFPVFEFINLLPYLTFTLQLGLRVL